MSNGVLLLSLVFVPVAAGILSQAFTSAWKSLAASLGGVLIATGLGCVAIRRTFGQGTIFAFSDWLFLDALSAYHLAVMLVVFGLSSIFAMRYFGEEMHEHSLTLQQVRTFAGLWAPALGAMTLVLVSNNLGIMWVGMEATTLVTSFLICVHLNRGSIEAMWKYMLICSVGIGFAFLGTLMIRVAAKDLPLDPNQALLWTNLLANTANLTPALVKAAFIFVLVGYGTKAGLAPMHSWLPDAHSMAPAPVSAIFSGFMLNTALYCILRYMPLAEGALGHDGYAHRLLVGFGLASILIAASFMLFQRDLKRLLAYCSVEHLGIIALGFGLGGLGTFAALFHTFNHSLCKSLSFFAAGRLGQIFKTHEMERMTGSLEVSPIWGLGIVASLLALIGMVPFSLFMSEFQMLKAAVDGGRFGVLVVFLFGTGTVFVGVLGNALRLGWGKPGPVEAEISTNWLDVLLVAAPLVVLLVLGVWMPGTFRAALDQAAAVVENVHRIVPVNLRGAP
ncbi:hydrogenase 4 subunit F [Candidatus Ozemobacteraceae bacterium]|nr:hydrogenase 4 subunit F [Candidatus Ozemobacteraceae bacterium]